MVKRRNTIIGVVPDIHFTTLHIASDQRVFEKYALQPDFREFSGGTGELAEALANGESEFRYWFDRRLCNVYFKRYRL